MHSPSFTGAWHEGWNLDWGATSHAWSSGPTALLSQKVLGLEPTGYGWKTFSVKTYMGDLLWAKGKVATVAGDISASWQRTTGNHFSLQLKVPKGTTATVYMPTNDEHSIKVSSKPFSGKTIGKMNKWTLLTVDAGTYQFECEIKD